ncbi:MAG: DUF2336 domain-containing protein [Alphaproteobacteria bacterium]|nr:DUF2336 domain-containing protein [Alphaproteobacteria bacterium]
MTGNPAAALKQLAKMRDPRQRHQLALGVTELCIAQPLSESARPVAGELLVTISATSQQETQLAMAEKLSACEWAPQTILRHLATQDIEVASIVIKKSQALTEEDMVFIAQTASPDHRLILAKRPNLRLRVTDTLAVPAEAPVLRALADNDTAEISEHTLEICLTVAKGHPRLREALARRHDLSTDYATRLSIMLPESWREELCRRFGLDRDRVENLTIEAAVKVSNESVEDEAKKVVELAAEEKRLNGEFAVEALKRGDEAVFDHAFARLCKLTVPQWRVALAMNGVRAAAMACKAAGLDRTAYPIVHKALRYHGRLHQALEGEAMTAAANVFRMYGEEKAAKVLRQMGSKA